MVFTDADAHVKLADVCDTQQDGRTALMMRTGISLGRWLGLFPLPPKR